MEKQSALTVVTKNATGSKQAIIDGIKTLLVEVNTATSKASEINDVVERKNMQQALMSIHHFLVEAFSVTAEMRGK